MQDESMIYGLPRKKDDKKRYTGEDFKVYGLPKKGVNMDNRFKCKCGQKVWFICDDDRYIECIACGQRYEIALVAGPKIFLREISPPEEERKTEGCGEKE